MLKRQSNITHYCKVENKKRVLERRGNSGYFGNGLIQISWPRDLAAIDQLIPFGSVDGKF